MKYNEAEIRKQYRELTLLLIEKKLSITTMESATSGQIASLITDTEGASAIMKGAYITYSNEAKIKIGVSADTIEHYTVYSCETAREMAMVCRREYGADIGIGVTGTMGNIDPANQEASVPGQVYFAIDFQGQVQTYDLELEPLSSRLMYKLAVAEEIVKCLLEQIKTKCN